MRSEQSSSLLQTREKPMGKIIDMLLAKKYASIPEKFEDMDLLTGQLLDITVPSRGSLEGILFLSGRYFDMQLLWQNMILKGENQDDEKFPQTFVIDKSVILLMNYAIDNGLYSLGCGSLQQQLAKHKTKVLQESNNVFDNIIMHEETCCDQS